MKSEKSFENGAMFKLLTLFVFLTLNIQGVKLYLTWSGNLKAIVVIRRSSPSIKLRLLYDHAERITPLILPRFAWIRGYNDFSVLCDALCGCSST
jgi:hypothetical protein